MTQKQLISVIMPVYNTEKYVGEAIESILNQTFKNFEFIIIDDGSIDNSYKICENYAKKDSRIKLFKNEENFKIVKTLNKWIKLSQWEYIARMDSDDIVRKDRLKIQIDFLEKNKEYILVSSNLEFIDSTWKITWDRKYNKYIEKNLFYESPICHACTMFRKEFFEIVGYYNNRFVLAEDYELRFRAYQKGLKFWLIKCPLFKYRIIDSSGKVYNLKKQLKATINVKEHAQKEMWLKFPFKAKLRLAIEKFMYKFIPAKIILFLFILLKSK